MGCAFCYICVTQNAKGNLKCERNIEPAFITKGYSVCKKALEKFKNHEASECHKVALEQEITIPKTNSDIIDVSNKAAKKTRAENRSCFGKIVQSLQYLGRQGLAIRWDNDEESNFNQLMKFQPKRD